MAKTVSLGEASALLDNALSKPAKRSGAKKTKRKTTKRTSARRPAKRKTTKRKTTKRTSARRPAKRKTTKRKTTKRTSARRPAKRKTTKRAPRRHVGGGKRHREGRILTQAEKKALGLKLSETYDEGDAKFLRDYMSHKKKYGQHPTLNEMARYHATGEFHEAKPKKRTNYAKLKPSEWPK